MAAPWDAVPDCTQWYTPLLGETCIRIANAQNLPADYHNYMTWNPSLLPDCTDMWAGTPICISKE